jgi:hypothetical protein
MVMRGIRFGVVRLRPVATALAVLAVVAAVAAAMSLLQDATRIAVYSPAGFTATVEEAGSCWTGSLAAQRAGAYRCMAGNSIYDPCFAPVDTDAAACPQGDPAANRGILLRLTSPLPQPPEAWQNPPDPAHPVPWYMELAGDGACGMLTGTRLPEFPLGCTVPGGPQSLVCSIPVPLAGKPAQYAALCGVWEGGVEVRDQRVYLVTAMWL